jgi:hypothetical protein
MVNAHSWLLKELVALGFKPYESLLPRTFEGMCKLSDLEARFTEKVANTLTKRQAVGLGLLARTYQLGISCLVNQLLQNYAGWNCSYRSLLETYFVVDWIGQDPQRFEAYFEGTAPGIGRIKADCCGRHPEFSAVYQDVSEVTHVGSRALHLPRKRQLPSAGEFPFSATSMYVSGVELTKMLGKCTDLLMLLGKEFEFLLIDHFDLMADGETFWKQGASAAKYGCLEWEPRQKKKEEGV